MKSRSFIRNCTGIGLSTLALAYIGTGCHSPEDDISQYGYPVFEKQKLKMVNCF